MIDCVRAYRQEAPAEITARVFALLDEYTGDVPRKDDLTLVILERAEPWQKTPLGARAAAFPSHAQEPRPALPDRSPHPGPDPRMPFSSRVMKRSWRLARVAAHSPTCLSVARRRTHSPSSTIARSRNCCERKYADRPSVEIVEADVLSVSLGEIAGDRYVLVGNVPYYITTPILFHALVPPRAMRSVYLVQKEVADRLSAPPGGKEYGALTVNVAAVAKVETLFKVPAGAFKPPPKVESAVIRITPTAEPLVRADQERIRFRTLVQGAFGMRRKQMRRVLRSLLNLDAAHADVLLAACAIDPEVRPETLSAQQFVAATARVAERLRADC